MKRMMIAAAVLAAPIAVGGAAMADSGADPGDQWNKQWEIRAECDRKLAEADSVREFRKTAAECNKKLAKLDRKQREQAVKAWRDAEKKWRWPKHDGPVFEWDGDDD